MQELFAAPTAAAVAGLPRRFGHTSRYWAAANCRPPDVPVCQRYGIGFPASTEHSGFQPVFLLACPVWQS